MKDASVYGTTLCYVRLSFNFWWESGRPHAVLALAAERPVEHIFLSPALLGATQLIRLNLGPIKSGERNCWPREPGGFAA